MKQIRFSPWLILVLAVVLVFAAGCERPDPQVEIATPEPQQPAAAAVGGYRRSRALKPPPRCRWPIVNR